MNPTTAFASAATQEGRIVSWSKSYFIAGRWQERKGRGKEKEEKEDAKEAVILWFVVGVLIRHGASTTPVIRRGVRRLGRATMIREIKAGPLETPDGEDP
jgi:hypothetical protein